MASFYGNIKNNSRASFIFDRFYESRYAMDQALTSVLDENGEVKGDGVFVNRYVLINYGYTEAGGYVKIDPEYVQASGETANSNHIVTQNNYRNFYTYNPSTNTYSLATDYYTRAQLNRSWYYYRKINFYDRYELNASGTGRVENSYFAANRNKDILTYHADYHLTVWMKIYTDNQERYIQVGRLKAEAPAFQALVDAPGELAPHFDYVQSSDINYMYHVPAMWDIKLNEAEDTTNNITYPYFNYDGFDEIYNKYDSTNTNEITMPKYKSGKTYPTHEYQVIDVTPDTYIRNWYYTKSGSTYTLSTGEYSGSATYYMKTQKQNADGSLVYSKQDDERRLTLKLPAIGNAVADLYDVLYGYKGQGVQRPYNRQMLFNWRNISPYNNITSSDDISMGWAMEEFKNYISELRFLSNGQIDGEPDFQNHGGLQSDWTLDDNTSFGYIYHKPRILWSTVSSTITSHQNINNGTGIADFDSSSAAKQYEEGTENPDLYTTNHYALNSIEYIYDHYSDSTTSLFGFARNSNNWLNAHV